MESVTFFQVVENEWRTDQDREWALGLVMSVDQGDGYVWVTLIERDDDGMFLSPRAEYKHKSKLRDPHKQVTDVSVELEDVSR